MKSFLMLLAPAAALLLAAPAAAQTAAAPADASATTQPAPAPAAAQPALGAPNPVAAAAAARYHGAPATKKRYHVVYQLNSNDPKMISRTLQTALGVMSDPRLKDKLEVEVVVFGGGTVALRKNQPYEADVLALQQAGVVLAQCEHSMNAQKLTKEDMLPYISIVPSANGELIIRQADGWAIMKL